MLVPRSSIDSSYRSDATPDAYGRTRYRVTPRLELETRSSYGDRYGSGDRRYYDDDRRYGEHHHHYSGSHDDHDGHGQYQGPVRYTDPRLQQVSEWYRDLLGRPLSPEDELRWRQHLAKGHPRGERVMMMEALGMLLGTDEFYRRVDGGFDEWVDAVTRATGRSLSREEAAHWREDIRRAENRQAVRIDLVRHLLVDHESEPVVVPQDRYRDPRFRDDRYSERRDALPEHARDALHDHEAHDREIAPELRARRRVIIRRSDD
ncbi:MAG: hypothetical protein WBC44_13775 [Planctomycetaceae bacterium]